MTRGERGRRGHGDPSLLRHAEAISVGAVAIPDPLHRLVHHQRRRTDRRQPGERGAAPTRSAEQGEQAGGDEPWLGVVGEARHPSQWLVQERSRQLRDRTVDGTVIAAKATQHSNDPGCPADASGRAALSLSAIRSSTGPARGGPIGRGGSPSGPGAHARGSLSLHRAVAGRGLFAPARPRSRRFPQESWPRARRPGVGERPEPAGLCVGCGTPAAHQEPEPRRRCRRRSASPN